MATYPEVLELIRRVVEHSQKKAPLNELDILAKEVNMKTEEFIATASERLNNSKSSTEGIKEPVGDISPRYLKHTPSFWISQMKGSPWYNAGFPGIKYKLDEAKDAIDGNDGITGYPPMKECTWQNLWDTRRSGFLIVMIKNFMSFNERYEYLRK